MKTEWGQGNKRRQKDELPLSVANDCRRLEIPTLKAGAARGRRNQWPEKPSQSDHHFDTSGREQ